MTKIDIFSGFLGAGKTTLIKKLLGEVYQGEKLVLIENEFGEISIDGGFLKESGVQISEMSSGCICCSLVGDFNQALKDVVAQFNPDRVLIEPSGVGKLSDVIVAVENAVAESEGTMVLGSAVAVVDASKVKVYMKNFGEFYNNQVESAGTLILSRTQKLTDEKLHTAVEMLREKNPDAAILTTPWDDLDGKTILSAIEKVSLADELLEKMRAEHEEHEHHHHHHHHHHDHDEHRECGCHDHDHDHEHEHHHHDHDEHCECGCHDHDHDHEHEHYHHDHDEHCECGCHDHDHEHEHHHHDHHHHDHDEHCECGCHDHEHHHEHEHHHHDHGEHCTCGCHDHDHHHHHADEVFTSWGVETPKKFTEDAIHEILEELDSGEYGKVLRAKGIVNGENGWIEFDYVPEEHEIRAGHPDYTGRLCVIGAELDEGKLKTLFGL